MVLLVSGLSGQIVFRLFSVRLVFNIILVIIISVFSSSESTAGDAGSSTAASSAPGELLLYMISLLIFLSYQSK